MYNAIIVIKVCQFPFHWKKISKKRIIRRQTHTVFQQL